MTPLPERTEPRKVTIEDLLRVKRAERPSAEFWSQFEQDLRAKQLAAIVEKRPWWIAMRLPQFARGLSRFQLPAGAAAVLALSFVTVREYRAVSTAPDLIASQTVISAVNSPGQRVGGGISQAEVALDYAGKDSRVVVKVADVERSSARTSSSAEAAHVSEPASNSGELTAMIPWAAPRSSVADIPEPHSTVLGELSQVHFAAAVSPGRDHDFAASVEVGSVVVASPVPVTEEDVYPAQVSPVSPREVRRNRILSSLVVADNSEGERSRLAQGREVLTSSLDDSRSYDSVHRVGMGGDRLTLKF